MSEIQKWPFDSLRQKDETQNLSHGMIRGIRTNWRYKSKRIE
jgi:hypothetical protein